MSQRKRTILWIVEILSPIALVCALVFFLSHIIYSGPKYGALAGKAERAVLQFVLEKASYVASDRPSDAPITVISGNDSDDFAKIREGDLWDFDPKVYGVLLEKVMQQQPTLVVMRWLAGMHPNPSDYAEFIQVLQRINAKERIIIAYPAGGKYQLPKELGTYARLLDDSLCSLTSQTCPYDPSWNNDWVVQVLIDEIGKSGAPSPYPDFLAFNLWTNFPSYILNLAPPDSLKTLSFSEAFVQDTNDLRDKLVFIGREFNTKDLRSSERKLLPYGNRDLYEERLITGARTVYNVTKPKKYGQLTDLHVFWAQIANLQMKGQFIRVATDQTILTLTLILVGAIFLTIFYFGGDLSLGLFTIYCVIAISANVVAINSGNYYLPPFHIIYVGFVSFVTIGFLSISKAAFVRWRLEQSSSHYEETAHLKANFISLMSHNLNTAVARMYGLIPVIKINLKTPEILSDLDKMAGWLGYLEQSIKSVLVASRMEERLYEPASISTRTLKDNFQRATRTLFRNQGYAFNLSLANEGLEVNDIPLPLDEKIVSAVLVSFVIVLAYVDKNAPLRLEFKFSEPEGEGDALMEFGVNPAGLTRDRIIEILQLAQAKDLAHFKGDFLTMISLKIISLFLATNNGRIIITEEKIGLGLPIAMLA
ncbi:MAG: hypothetical protein AB7T49_09885 [Oligoflexales bacterium]